MSEPLEPARLEPLTMSDLQRLCEATVLAEGVSIYDGKLISNPARSRRRIYAEVKGTAQTPYAVVIDLKGDGRDLEKMSCTCPSAKFRQGGMCKHQAAVLVAWSSAATSFVEVPEGTIEAKAVERRKKKRAAPKRGRADSTELIQRGTATLGTLLAELGHTGLGTLTSERVNQVRELAQNLRALQLRRLAPECLDLANLLGTAMARAEDFPSEAYARDLADLTFHIRGLARLIERTDVDAEDYRRLADELLGRTWNEGGLTTLQGLRLLDLGYVKRTTSDGFVLEESYLADVESGDLVKDTLIRPLKVAVHQPPKEDFGHVLLEISDAGLYPGYSPRRIRLRTFTRKAYSPEDIQHLLEKAPDTIDELSKRLQDNVSDVFAPRPLLCLFRPNHLFAREGRLYAIDSLGKGATLLLDDIGLDVLERALGSGPIQLLFGTVGYNSDGITIRPITLLTGIPPHTVLTSLPFDEPVRQPPSFNPQAMQWRKGRTTFFPSRPNRFP